VDSQGLADNEQKGRRGQPLLEAEMAGLREAAPGGYAPSRSTQPQGQGASVLPWAIIFGLSSSATGELDILGSTRLPTPSPPTALAARRPRQESVTPLGLRSDAVSAAARSRPTEEPLDAPPPGRLGCAAWCDVA
jgi:hypothetical protein